MSSRWSACRWAPSNVRLFVDGLPREVAKIEPYDTVVRWEVTGQTEIRLADDVEDAKRRAVAELLRVGRLLVSEFGEKEDAARAKVDEWMKRPYHVQTRPAMVGIMANVVEFEMSCIGHGDTEMEAIHDLSENLRECLYYCALNGNEPPPALESQ